MLVILEGIFMCFVLLMICVIGIANGPVGLVTFYEDDVKERVVGLGLTTKERIKRSTMISSAAIFIPAMIFVPAAVYLINGANGFMSAFLQMTAIYLIMGLFDRLFIDYYWVGHTKAWIIEGTEDLMPYIKGKTLIWKWMGTIVAFPLYAALVSWIISLI